MTGHPTSFELLADFLAALGQHNGLDAGKIHAQLTGSSELAKLIRLMFDAPQQLTKRGRPPKLLERWTITQAVQHRRVIFQETTERAIEHVHTVHKEQGGKYEEATIKRYYEAGVKMWPELARDKITLADLFTSWVPPEL